MLLLPPRAATGLTTCLWPLMGTMLHSELAYLELHCLAARLGGSRVNMVGWPLMCKGVFTAGENDCLVFERGFVFRCFVLEAGLRAEYIKNFDKTPVTLLTMYEM